MRKIKRDYLKKSENDDKKKDIWLNFEQYGLRIPDIMRIDCSNIPFREIEIFDAIVSDPPYGWYINLGFRAGARETGIKESKQIKLDKIKADKADMNEIEEEKIDNVNEENVENNEFFIIIKKK